MLIELSVGVRGSCAGTKCVEVIVCDEVVSGVVSDDIISGLVVGDVGVVKDCSVL